MNKDEEKRIVRLVKILAIMGMVSIFISTGAILRELGESFTPLVFYGLAFFYVLLAWALVNEGRVRQLFNRFGVDIEEVPDRGESA